MKMNRNKVFKNKNFILLWLSQLISEIGNVLLEFSLSWYIYTQTGSTLDLSICIVSIYIPKALISSFSGIIADRFNRKKLMIYNDIINGVLIFILFSIGKITTINMSIVIIFNVLTSIVSAIYNPAVSAAIQSVLSKDELKDAGALLQIESQFSNIIGAGLGGILFKLIGLKYLILLDGVSFLIAAFLESFIKLKILPNAGSFVLKKQYTDIIHFLLENKIILYTTLFAGIIANGIFMSLSLYLPGIFKNALNLSSVELGLFYSISGIASILTSMFFLYSTKNIDPYKWTLISLTLEGLVFVLVAIMSNLTFAYITAILFGFSCAICSISISILNRRLIPNNFMGRMGSFNILVNSITMPIFTLIYGKLGGYFDLQTIIIISALVFFILLIPAPFIFRNQKNKYSKSNYNTLTDEGL